MAVSSQDLTKYALSVSDVKSLTAGHNVQVLTDEDPKGPIDLKYGPVVYLLLPHGPEQIGHFVAIVPPSKNNNYQAEYFDPYARNIGLASLRKRIYYGTQSFADKISSNKTPLEKSGGGINTCGDWSVLRALHPNINNAAFSSRFIRESLTKHITPDQLAAVKEASKIRSRFQS